MTLNIDELIDRRRIKRRLTFWRTAAVVLAVVAIAALVSRFEPLTAGARIARIDIQGIILDDPDFVSTLKALADDPDIKAVILNIDSPGGTTVGAETLYEALRELGADKPVTATLGTVAASGGYIAAIAADHIVARGNTITGSIGVVFQSPEISGLLEKIGVRFEEVKSSPLKAEPSGYKPMSDAARAVEEALVADSYDWFLKLVMERRQMSAADARRVGDGRVYTGRQALDVGLIDALGGQDVARAWLESEHDIDPDLPVVDETPQAEEDTYSGLLGLAGNIFNLKLSGKSGLSVDGLVSIWHP